MGNSEQKSTDEAIQKLMDSYIKEIDMLKVERDALQKIILEELQNPQSLQTIHQTFHRKYSLIKNQIKDDVNNSVNNSNYCKKYDAIMINILFVFEMEKINVVTPTDFNLQNVYSTALEKYGDKENFIDINSLYFEYNGKDISTYFIKNNEVKDLNISDKGVINVIKKNNLRGA